VGTQFLAACTYTFAQRTLRLRRILERSRTETLAPRRKSVPEPPHHYLTTPTVSPVAIAMVIVQHDELPTEYKRR
jgi:hypothetical protein